VEEENEISMMSVHKAPRYDYKEQEELYLKKLKESKCETPRSQAKKQLRADLYKQRKRKEEEEKPKTARKTPSTQKNPVFLSPKGKLGKSREKELKAMKGRGLEKALSPGLRKSRN
jgi:hypothetical protein